MKVSNGTAEGQRTLGEFVEREVIYCVSYLISELAAKPEYMDDLMDVLMTYDYQTPAEEQGWEEDVDGGIVKRPRYREDYSDDDLLDTAEGMGFSIEEDMDESCGTAFFWVNDDGDKHGPYDSEKEAQLEMVLANRSELQAQYEEDNQETAASWEEACSDNRIEPYTRDVYEHWIVSNWLARKLEEQGEATTEFMGLTIWGRCTTGQSISMDNVIETIYNNLHSDDVS